MTPRRLRRLGNRREALRSVLAAFGFAPWLELPLIRRAVHQDARAEIGGEVAQPPHHVDGAGPHAGVGRRDRQALGRAQQIVQAGDGDAGIGGGAAQFGALRRARAGAARATSVMGAISRPS